MKVLFELLPLLVFFGAYVSVDIFFATGAGMVASAIQVIWLLLRKEKVPTALWISFGAFMVFGSLTLVLQDKRFVMFKPTLVYVVMAGGLAVSYFGFKRNAIKLMMQQQFNAPDTVWNKWLYAWIVFFLVLGVANIYVAHNFSEAIWVKFKVFGTMALSLIFMFLQIWRMMPYMKIEDAEK